MKKLHGPRLYSSNQNDVNISELKYSQTLVLRFFLKLIETNLDKRTLKVRFDCKLNSEIINYGLIIYGPAVILLARVFIGFNCLGKSSVDFLLSQNLCELRIGKYESRLFNNGYWNGILITICEVFQVHVRLWFSVRLPISLLSPNKLLC